MSLARLIRNGLTSQVMPDLPTTQIEYKGKIYVAYVNEVDQLSERENGGFSNDYTKLIHIFTDDSFKLQDKIKVGSENMFIASISKSAVKQSITCRRDYYNDVI